MQYSRCAGRHGRGATGHCDCSTVPVAFSCDGCAGIVHGRVVAVSSPLCVCVWLALYRQSDVPVVVGQAVRVSARDRLPCQRQPVHRPAPARPRRVSEGAVQLPPRPVVAARHRRVAGAVHEPPVPRLGGRGDVATLARGLAGPVPHPHHGSAQRHDSGRRTTHGHAQRRRSCVPQ